MFPSLLAMAPDYAESIVDFRYRQLGAAKENAKQFNFSGALYPWTAGRFGNCTGVGPCNDYEVSSAVSQTASESIDIFSFHSTISMPISLSP